ncbi:ribbon-helix-helix domain-containing protein [Candidatus Undinarchaeota archaeon]
MKLDNTTSKSLSNNVNKYVYMVQVQLRLSNATVKELDEWVKEGKFKNRSDAIRGILALYEEREKTREFYGMLMARSREAEEHPERLVPLEEIK